MECHFKNYKIALVLCICIYQSTLGQDSNYWIHQYGTRADLLSGLVVGSVKDLSSTYYNPGAIPHSPEQSLVLTTDAFEFSTITAKNAAGEGEDLRSRQSGSAPGIFAVRLTSSASVKNHWAISYLTRNNFKLNIDSRNIDPRPPSAGNLEQDYFSGEAAFSQSITEAWGGLTYGRRVWDRVAFGVTQYLAYRYQKSRAQLIGQLYDQTGEGSSLIFFEQLKFEHIRALWKIGLSFAYQPLSFGITFTTPGIGIYGSGETLYNLSKSGIDSSVLGTNQSSLASNYQPNVAAAYHSPLSIAAGARYRLRQSSIYFTLEWFDRVNEFTVLAPEDFIAQSSGNSISNRYEHELKSVTNYGLGIQHEFSEKLSLYLSGTLDKSARIPDSDSPFTISDWDIYHLTLGSSLTFWRVDLTVGLTFSLGSRDTRQSLLSARVKDTISEGRLDITEVKYRRLKFIIGFTILSNPKG